MVVLIVHSTVKAGAEEQARSFIAPMVEATRKEPGCRMYIGHQSTDNPRNFCFYEQYDDKAALASHRASPHFERYIKNGLGPLVETRIAELFEVVA